MADFLLFLGRFHVLVLHLPIGIVLAAVVLDAAARRERFRSLSGAAPLLWGAAAASAVLTAALGYLHLAEGGFDGAAAARHRLYGTAVALVTVVVWWLVARRPLLYRRVRLAAASVVVVLIVLTGHYGGNLTHGATYLTAYAPGPFRARGEPRAPAVPSAAAASAASLDAAGWLVRPVAASDARLSVSVPAPGRPVTATQLTAALAAATEIAELNLQDAAVNDADLAGFERFSALTHLRVSNARITDAGVRQLERLPRLEYLNLYGNSGITDAAVESFARMSALTRLHLWQTGVTEEAAARLRHQRPDLDVQLGAPALLPPAD